MRLICVILPALLFVAGCASGVSPLPTRLEIAPGVSFTLPVRPPFGADANAVQLVRSSFGRRNDRFQTIVEVTSSRFALAMAVPSGPHIVTIEWHEGAIVVRRGIAPESLPMQRLLVDFMLVYASDEAVREALVGAHFVSSGSGARRIFRNGNLLVEVVRPEANPWEGSSRLRNHVHGYELVIDSHTVK
ncbi:MAG: DUF3261 domain-containing protein [Parvibaculum sp.]|uniref:DUF3261 domain-containing protein n=1 Tax=Parvibaculum sp. TaxID=2024848 RepID=UPI002715CEEC|nr:DUF3261 domain-containing protein [Parvibaculum sp.]MDO8840120.1 DUF3261 domain-containing protein [Parvibaculum sp.]